ncbi:hypothetical protein IWX84_002554 [Flavobacterium sp. CG_9.10]|uniref:DUF4339 domain-containing protein n=1 Tax=Flavobacterium sp. CG_9.10 TaxID=2787729 RepID=UPI0018CB6526|nr:DUF4339 domain-containing protein [Flavobacterium sp. CG_9.10]MBG6111667.1 hypothetical protein [Flavobacterium sp. CG_9.10]
MNSYYLHNGVESSGPFDLSELKAKSITKTTPVWCEGMANWKNAGEVMELQSILTVVPPPIKSFQPSPELEETDDNPKILGIDKMLFFILCGLLVLIIGTVSFKIFDENRSSDLEQKNNITEKNNQQFQLQEKKIEEQKNLIAEQERIETDRIKKERKETLSNRLSEIKRKLAIDFSNLDQAKNKMSEANDFQFLRTTDEREEDINSVETEIENLKIDIGNLKTEMDQIYLELEKIK